MLAGLGHHRIVGGDDQHRQVEPGRAGEHVADEPLVAGDVHDREAVIADLQRREAQVDRDTPPLLRREPVGVHARQGADQRGLAVVDVAGSAQYEVADTFFHRDGDPAESRGFGRRGPGFNRLLIRIRSSRPGPTDPPPARRACVSMKLGTLSAEGPRRSGARAIGAALLDCSRLR